MSVKFANNAHSTLASSVSTSATSITVASGHGARFPSLSGSEFFYATLIDTSNNLEIVKVTARSTDVLTATRAQESTSARAFASGDRIELRVTAQGLVDATTIQADQVVNSMIATDAVNADSIVANAVTASELNISGNGTAGQAVLSDGDGSFSYGTAGGVLQVKQWRKLSTINNNSGSDSALSSPFDGTASITPSASGNPILCEWWSTVDHGTTWRSNFARIQYSVGGGTYTGLAGGAQSAYNEGTNMHGNQIFLSAMVNPATTSAVTFRIVVNGHSSGAGARWGQYNNEGTDNSNVAPNTDNGGVAAGHLIRLTEFDAGLVTLADVS